jgi:hypothetical protein
MNIVSVGEVLLDIVRLEEPHRGKTFNFSARLSKLGQQVSFVVPPGVRRRRPSMKINGYVLKSVAAIGGLLFASIPR